ncbi:hypothetical protein [Candidatus Amarolinea dominans]|uniref:hypothetical protein n=1 Tax=Candidatus Amarolinea dominans TaxID=3140696 RepID=UPI001D98A6CA|nr:hypothetical protein [Anaerolineae bacterium]
MEYPKPGIYWVAVDWLDHDGFWLGNLTAQALTIADPVPAQEMAILNRWLAAAPLTAPPEVAQTSVPWQPYRHARSAWNWAHLRRFPAAAAWCAAWRPALTWRLRPKPGCMMRSGTVRPGRIGFRPAR